MMGTIALNHNGLRRFLFCMSFFSKKSLDCS